MIFVRIPSFLKGIMNLCAVDTSFGCASTSSAAPQRKEIKERVKATLVIGKAKPTVSVEPFVATSRENSSVGCSFVSISVEAPVKRSLMLEHVKKASRTVF